MSLVPVLPYDSWIDEAMRGVVRRALQYAAEEGLPGAHHFYVSFSTTAPGVDIGPDLRVLYPEEMTIVLQHQFWDMVVGEEAVAVTLRFRGRPHRLTIPFAAVTAFVDPSVNFALQLRGKDGVTRAGREDGDDEPAAVKDEAAKPELAGDGGHVIALDSFRKK